MQRNPEVTAESRRLINSQGDEHCTIERRGHVAMLANYLDDHKSKRHLKSGFALFQTSSILFNFV